METWTLFCEPLVLGIHLFGACLARGAQEYWSFLGDDFCASGNFKEFPREVGRRIPWFLLCVFRLPEEYRNHGIISACSSYPAVTCLVSVSPKEYRNLDRSGR